MTKTKLAVVVLLTGAIGGSVGAYLTFHLFTQVWIGLALSSMSNSARVDAATIKLLRANKQDKAIELLCFAGKDALEKSKNLESDMREGFFPHDALLNLPKVGTLFKQVDSQRSDIENGLKSCGDA